MLTLVTVGAESAGMRLVAFLGCAAVTAMQGNTRLRRITIPFMAAVFPRTDM
jgi:hypothetical protein